MGSGSPKRSKMRPNALSKEGRIWWNLYLRPLKGRLIKVPGNHQFTGFENVVGVKVKGRIL